MKNLFLKSVPKISESKSRGILSWKIGETLRRIGIKSGWKSCNNRSARIEQQGRRLGFESLETRTLLAVTAGDFAIEPSNTTDPAASTVIVTTQLDVVDSTDGVISLREALMSTRTTITFDSSLSGGMMMISGGEELKITKRFTIDASELDQGFTINAVGAGRIFNVTGGTQSSPVKILGLTLLQGKVTSSSEDDPAMGGAIYNSGALTLTDVTICLSQADGSGACGGGIANTGTLKMSGCSLAGCSSVTGGAIYNKGTLTFTNGNIFDSQVTGTMTYGGGIANDGKLTISRGIIGRCSAEYGGGILNRGTLEVTNSALYGNTATIGGGIYNLSGSATLTLVTISGNSVSITSSSGGGGIYNVSGITLVLENCLVSLNYGGNVYGSFTSRGGKNFLDYNPYFVTAPIFDASGSLTNGDSLDLHLRSDSLAINAGNNAMLGGSSVDLGGKTRLVGGVIDFGAYEYQEDRSDSPIPYSSVVTTLDDSFNLSDGEWSLREAIYWASQETSITFAQGVEGTMTLTNGMLVVDRGLSIDGGEKITLSAEYQTGVVLSGVSAAEGRIILSGLALMRGSARDGGGIYHLSGNLTLQHSTITNCTAQNDGGGIYNRGTLTVISSKINQNSSSYLAGGICSLGDLNLTDADISENYATNNGGGIYACQTTVISGGRIYANQGRSGGGALLKGTAQITDCVISQNRAASLSSQGGGIYNYGNLTIQGGEISKNTISYYQTSYQTIGGGGIYNAFKASVTITGTEISGNQVTAYSARGGGIYNDQGSFTLSRCKIADNLTISDYSYGGGIYNDKGTLSLSVCILSGNGATTPEEGSLRDNYGGALYNASGSVSILSSTLAGNFAQVGGGLYDSPNKVTLVNSIVSQNHASAGAANIYGVITDESESNLIGYYPDFVVAPEFNDDGTLANSGQLDLHLKTHSAAVDAGDNESGAEITVDFDGNSRLIGTRIDLGAYEYQRDRSDDAVFYSSVITTLDDSFDPDDGKWSLREAIYWMSKETALSLASNLNGAMTLSAGEIVIDRVLSLNGDGRMILNGNGQNRILNVVTGLSEGTTALYGLRIQNGLSEGQGGGINNSGQLLLANCAVIFNNAQDGGGIANHRKGKLTLTNVTIAKNRAERGGGIYNDGAGKITAANSIVATNIGNLVNARSSVDIYLTTGDASGKNNLSSFNSWNTAESSDNLIYDSSLPLFQDIASFDFGLPEDSQAVDKGNNDLAVDLAGNPLTYDLARRKRIVDGTVDIGAYEYSGSGTIKDVVIGDYTGEYDGAFHGASITGLLTGDTVSYSLDGLTYDSTPLTYKNAGTYSFYVRVTRDGYQDLIKGVTVQITLRTLSITGTTVADKDYDGKTDAVVTMGTVTGIVSGEDVQITPNASFPSADAGSYTVSVGYSMTGRDVSNYSVPLPDRVTASILPVQIKAPTNLKSVSAGANRITLSWDPPEHVSYYYLFYTSDSVSWTTVETKETSSLLTGLTYGSSVTWKVFAIADGKNATGTGISETLTHVVCPMDINMDGKIGLPDYRLFTTAWLERETRIDSRCDINGDDRINLSDYLYLSANWLKKVSEVTHYPPMKAPLADLAFDDLGNTEEITPDFTAVFDEILPEDGNEIFEALLL